MEKEGSGALVKFLCWFLHRRAFKMRFIKFVNNDGPELVDLKTVSYLLFDKNFYNNKIPCYYTQSKELNFMIK